MFELDYCREYSTMAAWTHHDTLRRVTFFKLGIAGLARKAVSGSSSTVAEDLGSWPPLSQSLDLGLSLRMMQKAARFGRRCSQRLRTLLRRDLFQNYEPARTQITILRSARILQTVLGRPGRRNTCLYRSSSLSRWIPADGTRPQTMRQSNHFVDVLLFFTAQ